MEDPVRPKRRAPYAPVGALNGFLATVRNGNPPARVDVAYLRSHALARGNEWALISALKFLGVLDDRGHPTPIFRRIQGSRQATKDTLANLVLAAYQPLFEDSGAEMSMKRLKDWFAEHSSPSQAANATRFFREVCQLAGIDIAASRPCPGFGVVKPEKVRPEARSDQSRRMLQSVDGEAAAALVSKMPSFHEWGGSAGEYLRLIEAFGQLAQGLSRSGIGSPRPSRT